MCTSFLAKQENANFLRLLMLVNHNCSRVRCTTVHSKESQVLMQIFAVKNIRHFSHRVLTDNITKHLHLQIRIFLLFLQNKNVMMVSLLYSSIEMKGREKKSTFQKVLNKNHFPRTYGSPRILLGLHTLNGGDDGLFQKALLWSKNTMIQI